jgi:hypothetical protein
MSGLHRDVCVHVHVLRDDVRDARMRDVLMCVICVCMCTWSVMM